MFKCITKYSKNIENHSQYTILVLNELFINYLTVSARLQRQMYDNLAG